MADSRLEYDRLVVGRPGPQLDRRLGAAIHLLTLYRDGTLNRSAVPELIFELRGLARVVAGLYRRAYGAPFRADPWVARRGRSP